MPKQNWITNADAVAAIEDLTSDERFKVGRAVLFRLAGQLSTTPDDGAISSFVLRSTVIQCIDEHKRERRERQEAACSR